jgi:hypothetical protein
MTIPFRNSYPEISLTLPQAAPSTALTGCASVCENGRQAGQNGVLAAQALLDIFRTLMPCLRRPERKSPSPTGGIETAKYDIFKKTEDSVVWVEAVEDIVQVKKRLISLAANGPDRYVGWDSTQQQFIDVLDDCA